MTTKIPENYQTQYANALRKHEWKNLNRHILSCVLPVDNSSNINHLSFKDVAVLCRKGLLPKIDQKMIHKFLYLTKPNLLATMRDSMETIYLNAISETIAKVNYDRVTENEPAVIDITFDVKNSDTKKIFLNTFMSNMERQYDDARALSYGDFGTQNHVVEHNEFSPKESDDIGYYDSLRNIVRMISEQDLEEIQESLVNIFDDGGRDTLAFMEDVASIVSQSELDDFDKTMQEYRNRMNIQLADLQTMIKEDSVEDEKIKDYMEKHFNAIVNL